LGLAGIALSATGPSALSFRDWHDPEHRMTRGLGRKGGEVRGWCRIEVRSRDGDLGDVALEDWCGLLRGEFEEHGSLRGEALPTRFAHDAGGPDQRRPPSLRAVLKEHPDMTIYTPELVQRNATFAAGGAFKGLPFPTNPALRVIGCVDSRVDPSDVLGLKLGEAVVMRNVGGRVTPEALR